MHHGKLPLILFKILLAIRNDILMSTYYEIPNQAAHHDTIDATTNIIMKSVGAGGRHLFVHYTKAQ